MQRGVLTQATSPKTTTRQPGTSPVSQVRRMRSVMPRLSVVGPTLASPTLTPHATTTIEQAERRAQDLRPDTVSGRRPLAAAELTDQFRSAASSGRGSTRNYGEGGPQDLASCGSACGTRCPSPFLVSSS